MIGGRGEQPARSVVISGRPERQWRQVIAHDERFWRRRIGELAVSEAQRNDRLGHANAGRKGIDDRDVVAAREQRSLHGIGVAKHPGEAKYDGVRAVLLDRHGGCVLSWHLLVP